MVNNQYYSVILTPICSKLINAELDPAQGVKVDGNGVGVAVHWKFGPIPFVPLITAQSDGIPDSKPSVCAASFEKTSKKSSKVIFFINVFFGKE